MPCCCCGDYFVSTAPSGLVTGHRVLRMSGGAYPANQVQIKKDFVVHTRTATNAISVDYYNKLIFLHEAQPGGVRRISSIEFTLNPASRKTVVNLAAGAFGVGVPVVVDGVRRKVFYTNGVSQTDLADGLGNWRWVIEVRSINYDGTGDAQLTTETIDANIGFAPSITGLLWTPQSYVYYLIDWGTKIQAGGGHGHRQLQRMNNDGSGKTTVIDSGDIPPGSGAQTLINFLGASYLNGKLFWSQQDRLADTTINRLIKSCDLNGGGITTLFTINSGSDDRTINAVKANQKNNSIVFEIVNHAGAATNRCDLYYMGTDGANPHVVMDSFQKFWVDGATDYRTFGAIRAAFGCKQEQTGADFHSGGYML